MERLTVERAKELCNKHKVKLGHKEWAPTNGNGGRVCPNGLLFLEHFEAWDEVADVIIAQKQQTYYATGRMATLDRAVCEMMCEKTGLSHDYAFGLNNGFEGDPEYIIKPDDQGSEDYRQGVEDGKALAAYAE